ARIGACLRVLTRRPFPPGSGRAPRTSTFPFALITVATATSPSPPDRIISSNSTSTPSPRRCPCSVSRRRSRHSFSAAARPAISAQLERLLDTVGHLLPLNPGGEFSVEANPDSLTADKVTVLADHGVTRISLGAQSFHPHLLRVLERAHGPDEMPRAVERVRKR